jgi:hypothetical protein
MSVRLYFSASTSFKIVHNDKLPKIKAVCPSNHHDTNAKWAYSRVGEFHFTTTLFSQRFINFNLAVHHV